MVLMNRYAVKSWRFDTASSRCPDASTFNYGIIIAILPGTPVFGPKQDDRVHSLGVFKIMDR